MSNRNRKTSSKVSAHHKAESHLRADYNIKNMSQEDVQELILELQTHQIELTMQNEELLKTQQELQELKDLYFDLYNFAPAGYLTVNSDGTITEANLASGVLLGTEIANIIGKPITSFIEKSQRDEYLLYLNELYNKETRQSGTIKMLKEDGTEIYSKLESDVIKDKSGNKNIHLAFVDISNNKLTEQNLEKTVLALTRSNTELERFTHVASHDLREPLRSVSSCAQMLGTNYASKLDEKGKKLVNYIIEGVNKMNAMIGDLLAYSRQGAKSRNFIPVDCQDILKHVIENLQCLITESGTKITYGVLPTIPADGTQMVQLFQNIISNAIHHNKGNSTKIHVGAERKGDYWLFSIKDNGMGIDGAYLDKIFGIFEKLDVNSKYQGTGIGLAICKQVVSNHHGRIWAESDIGKNTIFYFTLPANDDD